MLPAMLYRFGDFELDFDRIELRSAGTPLPIEPQVFAIERVFDHVIRVASGEVLAKAEETKHREFEIWGEQSVSL